MRESARAPVRKNVRCHLSPRAHGCYRAPARYPAEKCYRARRPPREICYPGAGRNIVIKRTCTHICERRTSRIYPTVNYPEKCARHEMLARSHCTAVTVYAAAYPQKCPPAPLHTAPTTERAGGARAAVRPQKWGRLRESRMTRAISSSETPARRPSRACDRPV